MSAPLRIAYVFPGGVDGMGGAETQALHYLVAADRTRVRPRLVLLGRNAAFLAAAAARGIEDVVPLNSADRGPWHPAVAAEYRRWLRAEPCDLVHLYGLRQEVMSRPVSALAGGTKVVSAIRGQESHRGALHHALDRFTSRWVDLWISNSAATGEEFRRRLGFGADRLAVIPNGVELPDAAPTDEQRAAVRRGLGIHVEAFACICVANHLPDKRIPDLVKALAAPPLAGRDVVLVLAGRTTPETDVIRSLAAGLGVENRLRILGYRDDVPGLLAGMDALALPSAKEGMPSSVLEGMARGLPVVATPVASLAELVEDGASGYLVPVGDPGGLSAALARLADDPAHARSLGARSRRIVAERYSVAAMAQALTARYELLCGRPRL